MLERCYFISGDKVVYLDPFFLFSCSSVLHDFVLHCYYQLLCMCPLLEPGLLGNCL